MKDKWIKWFKTFYFGRIGYDLFPFLSNDLLDLSHQVLLLYFLDSLST